MRLIAGTENREPVIRFELETDEIDNSVDVIAILPDGERVAILTFHENPKGLIGFHTYCLSDSETEYFDAAANGRLAYT